MRSARMRGRSVESRKTRPQAGVTTGLYLHDRAISTSPVVRLSHDAMPDATFRCFVDDFAERSISFYRQPRL